MTNDAADKAFYDDQGDAQDPFWTNWHHSPKFTSYVRVSESLVRRHFASGLHTSLELGAGTCTLSLALSHLPMLGRMICMDISAERMRTLAPKVASTMTLARQDKLEHLAGSFNERLPFDDASIDLVLFDAALHHASSPWELLAECRRVLRPGGLLVAQREQYLATSTFPYVLRRLLKTEEVRAGVVENAFLRAQYEYFLRARGFEPRFTGVAESALQRVLSFSNGMLFSKWVISARPV